ncbi:hypothetical protein FD754_009436 [Muntiacus muntjak]|uniref:Rab-GAP TBC domain-containing protein n=1 Tax=Muntiacus muntjak TaxID=9888 RepID=A0A5N3WTY4_MUNMU|nr:hypothetical protein FD754_009436 [Muntiacus muntjak]
MVGYSPWGRKELDTTERLHFHFHHVTGGEESAAAARGAMPRSAAPQACPWLPTTPRADAGSKREPRTMSCRLAHHVTIEELHCLTEFDDTFAKKFEVLFCGSMVMELRKWLLLLDQLQSALQPLGDAERALSQCASPSQSPGCGSLAFEKEFQDAGLRSSSFFSSFEESDIQNHLISLELCSSQLVNPKFTSSVLTPKKIALEKNFQEISFCSQAFMVALVQQTVKALAPLCEGCPLQELQKHLTTLTNQEQATIFEENELVISFLRCLHEEKLKVHVHIGEIKQTSQIAAENTGSELPSSATRFRLDMLKNKAKRSLTEPLESILSQDNKARGLQEHSASLGLDTSMSDIQPPQPAWGSLGVSQKKLVRYHSDFESKANHVGDASRTPIKMRGHSWRQQIFLRLGELSPRSPLEPVRKDGPFSPVPEEQKRTSLELRELWQKAILQQILLLRMEKENQKLQLDYEEITPCLKEVTTMWGKMLTVPRHHRGEIWKFLVEQCHLKHLFLSKQQPKDMPYKELLKQLTSQQHTILSDLGQTFPTRQLSLYNILKACSLLDEEVGYCQGLSFVAGSLLLHMGEEEMFNMLKFLMFDEHEIGPSLYAMPWFLTVFALQFPLGFVARVIFKVALSLLGYHKPLILQQENLETIVDSIKSTLLNLGLVQMLKTISQEERIDSSLSDHQRMDKLEKTNSSLRKQNLDLLEQPQQAKAGDPGLGTGVVSPVQTVGQLWRQMAELGCWEPDPTLLEPSGN